MSAGILTLPGASGAPRPASLREIAHAIFALMVEESGLTEAEFAHRMNEELGAPVASEGLVRIWCELGAATPPLHYALAAARVAGRGPDGLVRLVQRMGYVGLT